MSKRQPAETSIGKTYGRLTIMAITRDSRSRAIAKCQCDCGKIKEIQLDSVKRGLTTSCNGHRSKAEEKIGKKFYSITIIDIKRDKYNLAKALSSCDCGSEPKWRLLTHIETGRIQSCGCQYIKSIEQVEIGKVYGRYTVLSVVSAKGIVKAACLCQCGNSKLVRLNHLKTGRTLSCGCHAKDTLLRNNYTRTFKEGKKLLGDDRLIPWLLRHHKPNQHGKQWIKKLTNREIDLVLPSNPNTPCIWPWDDEGYSLSDAAVRKAKRSKRNASRKV